MGRDLRLRRFTPAAARVFGLVATDLGRPMTALRPLVAIAPALTRLVPEVIERPRPAECAIQDAAQHWHHLTVRPYVTLDGRIDGAVVSARDVDAEKRGAERLAAARRYAEDIVDTVREGLVVLDSDFRVRSTNRAFQRAFRLAAGEAVGRHLDEVGRAELAAPALRDLLAGLGTKDVISDFRLEHRDAAGGLPRAFLLNARRIEGTELILLAIEDVTEVERVAAAARQAELSFRDALTNAAEGILMVDRAGRVLFANRVAVSLFGYTAEEITGLSVDLLLPERFRETHALHRAEYLGAPSPRPMALDRDLLARRKDGTKFPVQVVLSTMAREDGPVAVAFVMDVTQRRAAEREIHAYQKKLQRMAFDAALTEEQERRRIAIELHDRIGQDLALAQIKLTAVRNQLAGEPRAAVDDAVERLEQAASDTRTLVFDLSPPVLYDLGLKEALAWLADDVEKRHGVQIEVVDDGATKPLDEATRALVFRAVRELLMNVLKHAKVPTARVSLRRSGDHFDIDVEDRGIGFDPDAAAHGSEGRGFGLLSVREQIARLGGTVKVESAPQKGTCVTVRVPLKDETAAAQPAPAGDPAGNR